MALWQGKKVTQPLSVTMIACVASVSTSTTRNRDTVKFTGEDRETNSKGARRRGTGQGETDDRLRQLGDYGGGPPLLAGDGIRQGSGGRGDATCVAFGCLLTWMDFPCDVPLKDAIPFRGILVEIGWEASDGHDFSSTSLHLIVSSEISPHAFRPDIDRAKSDPGFVAQTRKPAA